jgi:hypothetical protein
MAVDIPTSPLKTPLSQYHTPHTRSTTSRRHPDVQGSKGLNSVPSVYANKSQCHSGVSGLTGTIFSADTFVH